MTLSLSAKAIVRDRETGEEREVEVETGMVGPVQETLANAIRTRLEEVAQETRCEPIRFTTVLTVKSHGIVIYPK